MQIKIFVNEKPIYLTNTLSENIIALSKEEATIFVNNEKINAALILSQLENKNKKCVIIVGKNFTSIKKEFFSQFKNISAAGGIVLNENKELLLIFRNNKWDLPKGKLEENESIENCAAREIEEETGVTNLSLKRKVGETFHIYTQHDELILKTAHWFYFTTTNHQTIVPQKEEGIEIVKWINTIDIKTPMTNTFNNIKEILSIFFDTP